MSLENQIGKNLNIGNKGLDAHVKGAENPTDYHRTPEEIGEVVKIAKEVLVSMESKGMRYEHLNSALLKSEYHFDHDFIQGWMNYGKEYLLGPHKIEDVMEVKRLVDGFDMKKDGDKMFPSTHLN